MTPPRLVSCYFETPGSSGQWARLARVLAWSAATHCPGWTVHIDHLAPSRNPAWPAAPASHARNTQKLEHWHQRALEAQDGDRVLLMDADTVILRPLEDAWVPDVDLAYTVKLGPFPFNAGVLFLRMSDRIRIFLAAWVEANARLMMDTGSRNDWTKQFGGINQASLGPLLASPPVDVVIRPLPCTEWNCEDSSWRHFDPAVTRILHLKSGLRRACFSRLYDTPAVSRLARLWQSFEATSTAQPMGVSA